MTERRQAQFRLHVGSCLDLLAEYPDNHFDSVVCDPPYGITFMGREWDTPAGIAFQPPVWRECMRVLKPGGYLLAFGGTRMFHRLMCAVEDAGFEMRDMIAWLYASGFPKSHNLDNLRGETFCGCEPEIERDVRPVHSSDVSAPINASEQGASTAERGQLSISEIRSTEPSMEGRGDDQTPQGQLRERAVREVPLEPAVDGTQGRMRDAAPFDHGSVVRLSADANGSRASREPRSAAQPTSKPRTMAGQPEPQAMGAWPVCGRCGLQILPKGLGTALKPAIEPICMGRKPFPGTVAQNLAVHGVGAINIDGCRVGIEEITTARPIATSEDKIYGKFQGGESTTHLGRWPANICHDGSDVIVSQFPDVSSGSIKAGTIRNQEANIYGKGMSPVGVVTDVDIGYADSGSAARFFNSFKYCAKASMEDREQGLEDFELIRRTDGRSTEHEVPNLRTSARRNPHPTVKPVELMQWLVRLVTPKGGLVLDPFMGSGSTGKACMLEGFRFVGMDLTPEYEPVARARITWAIAERNRLDPFGFNE